MPIDEIENLSVNAEKFAEKLHIDDLSNKIIVAEALSMVHTKILDLLIKNLKRAIKQTEEYDTPLLKGHLLRVFDDPDMVNADEAGNLFIKAGELAGTANDFAEGMEAARAALNLKGKGDIVERAEYWKTIIYLPARKTKVAAPKKIRKGKKKKFKRKAKEVYDKTIDARVEAWNDLAPFWIFLEAGNLDYPEAFPNFDGQYFVENTRLEGQRMLDVALAKVNVKLGNTLADDFEDFSRDIDTARSKPGRIIDRVFIGHREYVFYVTPIRKQIGFALESSRKRILRAAGV